ncbi:hypothetical protein [Hyphomicrobium sp. MC1]|uniref:hypothetical protein n=1 Tax=Hyphomicrobium sp. (strain MC1) TaxID=717785 RepID=UPI0002ED9A23|nr:hypothetical protein [Hyphomicrobium sp. MC1]
MTDIADKVQEMRDNTVYVVRKMMYDDDACSRIVPSDLRLLIGEIDRLRAKLAEYDELKQCIKT